ncbi:hypothetical protein GM51_15520, partial [freshwater metagenome]
MSRGSASNHRRKVSYVVGLVCSASSVAFVSVGSFAPSVSAADEILDAGSIVPTSLAGTVSGVVFNDKNGDGERTSAAAEPGVAGSDVKAFDSAGAPVGTATTDADGAYSISITGAATSDVRIEFSTPTGYQPAPHGTDNGTSIQFAQLGDTGVDYGVLVPENFCGDNQDVEGKSGTIVASCFYPGASDWTPGSNTWETGVPAGTPDRGTVKYTPWNATNNRVGAETTMAVGAQTGAIWGLGYQRTTGLLFTSAVVRRHADLGPQGIGGLYVMRYGDNGVAAQFDLSSVFSAQGVAFTDDATKWTRTARGIATPSPLTSTNALLGQSIDVPGFDGVGKEGIGDIDVSPDGQFLWVVNLYERTLLRIALTGTRAAPALGTLTEFAIPTNVCVENGSEERPWAVDPRPDGTVRVGLVCDNAGSQSDGTKWSLNNLTEGAFVYELTPGTSAWTELVEVDLANVRRYDRGCIGDEPAVPVGNPSRSDGRCWGAWVSPWANYAGSLLDYLPQVNSGSNVYMYGQPLLMDIENLADGSLALGFGDRTSLQFGTDNLQPVPLNAQVPSEDPDYAEYNANNTFVRNFSMGDLMLACKKNDGTWQVETGGSCSGANTYTGVVDGNDNLNPGGEFFQDAFSGDHLETRQGGLATMPGTNGPSVLASASMDPCDIYQGGIYWNNLTNGTKTENCAVYTGIGGEGPSPVGFGKATSMGDLETICDSAPIEIGNRLWFDMNDNGVQDPGEGPIAGVTLNLYDSTGTKVGTAVTNALGEYYFTSLIAPAPDGDDDPGDHIGGGVRPFESFKIRIDNPDNWAPGAVLDSTSNRLAKVDETAANGAESDAVDSDFSVVNSYPELAVAARLPGHSNHTFDAGIVPSLFAVGNYTWFDADDDGVQDAGELPLAGVAVDLYTAGGELVASAVTDANGFYLFDGLRSGEYFIDFTPPDGYVFTDTDAGSDDTKDSDAFDYGNFGSTDNFWLRPGEPGMVANTDQNINAAFVNPTIDAGFVVPTLFSVGNYTWLDTDRDGIQDQGEPPLAGVSVELWNGDGLVASAVTDANGRYLFSDLPEGEYWIEFYPPNGYVFTDNDAGSDNTKDSDAVDFGNFGSTDNFWLRVGEPGVNASRVNPTIDAGFVEPAVFAVGDFTWLDTDRDGIQDQGEPPLAGVRVELWNGSGMVASAVTDANGLYLFDGLPEGEYWIEFYPPDGYAFTDNDAG